MVVAGRVLPGRVGDARMVALATCRDVPVVHGHARAAPRSDVVTNVALTVFGIVYIPMLAGYVFSVLRLPDGRGLGLAVIGLTFAYDIAAFFVGYVLGAAGRSRRRSARRSPGRAWSAPRSSTCRCVASVVAQLGRSTGHVSRSSSASPWCRRSSRRSATWWSRCSSATWGSRTWGRSCPATAGCSTGSIPSCSWRRPPSTSCASSSASRRTAPTSTGVQRRIAGTRVTF